jgi:CRP/FNR family cyclic AMP-dependent transcriptional regulator
VTEYRRNESIYSEGETAETVMYIQKGGVKFSVVNESGKEAVVAMFGPSEFFGEGCMAGQTYMLNRNIRIEEDLIDQLFNSSEKRLARTLLLLARYGKQEQPDGILPLFSQETAGRHGRNHAFTGKFLYEQV